MSILGCFLVLDFLEVICINKKHGTAVERADPPVAERSQLAGPAQLVPHNGKQITPTDCVGGWALLLFNENHILIE